MRARPTGKTPDDRPCRTTARADMPAAGLAELGAGPMSAHTILALQRTVGNAAVVEALAQLGHVHAGESGHGNASTDAAVQRDAAAPRSAVHQVLRAPGRPLAEPVRAEMEARLGADFSDVRVHTDSAAHTSAESVDAHAYTSGSHIVFQRGRYDPRSTAGKHTLAHELTHVVQQRTGPVAGTDNGSGLQVSDPADRFERAAEANASRAMSGPIPQETRRGLAGARGTGPVQRAALPIQRVRLSSGNIAFTNVSENPQYSDKATRVLELLSALTSRRSTTTTRDCCPRRSRWTSRSNRCSRRTRPRRTSGTTS
jgi:hypothetical protein